MDTVTILLIPFPWDVGHGEQSQSPGLWPGLGSTLLWHPERASWMGSPSVIQGLQLLLPEGRWLLILLQAQSWGGDLTVQCHLLGSQMGEDPFLWGCRMHGWQV